MRQNSIRAFWSRQSETAPLNQEQLDAIKVAFGVAGEIRLITTAPGYAVTDDGRVFSGVCCSWSKECPRELRPIPTGAGYRMVRLHINKRATAEGIHRLVAFAFLSPPTPAQDRVRHLDGDPTNNVVGNLVWGTQKENCADAIRHGRTLKGLKNPQAKMTPKRVLLSRMLQREGVSDGIIGTLFGVTSETIRRACNGEQWGHV